MAVIEENTVRQLGDGIFGKSLHHKQRLSIARGIVAVMHADDLSISGVGRGLARANGTSPKHCIKQVDRFLSNDKIDVEEAQINWTKFDINSRREIFVVMD